MTRFRGCRSAPGTWGGTGTRKGRRRFTVRPSRDHGLSRTFPAMLAAIEHPATIGAGARQTPFATKPMGPLFASIAVAFGANRLTGKDDKSEKDGTLESDLHDHFSRLDRFDGGRRRAGAGGGRGGGGG